jgi:hypothetical protein
MIRVMLTAVALAASAAAMATIPPPVLDEAAKAKAAEAAAKTAYQAKMDAYQMCKVQDRIAAGYKKTHAGGAGAVKPTAAASMTTAAAAPMPAASMSTAAAKPAAPASASMAAAKSTSPSSASASQGGSTPVAAVAPVVAVPGCADPGPFAYAPPEQKPLETSGAHSPAANATSPPSVRSNSAEMAPSKPGVGTKP